MRLDWTKVLVLIIPLLAIAAIVGGTYYRNSYIPRKVFEKYGSYELATQMFEIGRADGPVCSVRVTKEVLSREEQKELMRALYRYNRHCRYIVELDLGACHCDAEMIRTVHWLDRLQILRLSGPDLHGDALEPLRHLGSLQELSINSPSFDDQDIAHYIIVPELRNPDRLWELTQLTLRRSAISDAGVAALKDVRMLSVLDISDTNIDGSGLAAIAALPLTTLDVSGTRVGNPALEPLVTSSTLKLIMAHDTGVDHQLWKKAGSLFPDLYLSSELKILYSERTEAGAIEERTLQF